MPVWNVSQERAAKPRYLIDLIKIIEKSGNLRMLKRTKLEFFVTTFNLSTACHIYSNNTGLVVAWSFTCRVYSRRTLDYVDSTTENSVLFTSLCFTLRILTAIGSTASATAGFACVASSFPDNISLVIGILESAVGLGIMIGPALGGILYSVFMNLCSNRRRRMRLRLSSNI